MNSIAKTPSGHFYPLIVGIAILAAFVLSPTPDFITVALLSLFTISGSIFLGFSIRRWSRLPFTRSSIITLAAVVIGVFGSIISFLGVRYLPILF